MKKLKIKVSDTKPEGMSENDYEKLKKQPPIECNAVTAVENVRNSKGLYEIMPEPKDIEAEFKFQGTPIEKMDREQLIMSALNFGVTIKNKAITTDKLRELVQAKFDEIASGADE